MNDIIPVNVVMCIKYLQSIDGLIVDDEEIQFYYHKRNDKEFLFVLFQDCYSEEFKENRERLIGGEWQKQENGEYYLYFNVNVIFSCIFDLFDKMRQSMFTWKEQPSMLDLKEEAGKMVRI
jgi:hypothetical protein